MVHQSNFGQSGVPALTRREKEVVQLASRGLSGREIAEHLCRSPRTIENHLRSVYRKFGVRNRVEMVRVAQAMGVLEGAPGSSVQAGHAGQQVQTASGTRPAGSPKPYAEIELKSRAYQVLRLLDAALARQSNHGYFGKLALTLSKAFGVRWAGISETSEREGILDIITFAADGKLGNSISFPLIGSPCGDTLMQGQRIVLDNLKTLYPNDAALDGLPARSYVGVRLEDRLIGPVGTLWIMDDKPIPADLCAAQILGLFARRTAAELALAKTLDRLDEEYAPLGDISGQSHTNKGI